MGTDLTAARWRDSYSGVLQRIGTRRSPSRGQLKASSGNPRAIQLGQRIHKSVIEIMQDKIASGLEPYVPGCTVPGNPLSAEVDLDIEPWEHCDGASHMAVMREYKNQEQRCPCRRPRIVHKFLTRQQAVVGYGSLRSRLSHKTWAGCFACSTRHMFDLLAARDARRHDLNFSAGRFNGRLQAGDCRSSATDRNAPFRSRRSRPCRSSPSQPR